MRVSYQWLRDYVNIDISPEDLAERLTMAGIAVEAVVPPVEGLEKILVGKILDVDRHPDSDHLMLCRVDTGSDVIQIICGAPNVRAGVCVPVALPGTILPGGMKVEAREIRGQTSQGMICSGAELGTDDWGYGDDQGILILPEGVAPGTRLDEALGLNDRILELELTPNRGDCLAVINVAREVRALTGAQLKLPEITLARELDEHTGDAVRVKIEAPDLCRRYACRIVRNIRIGPSPFWMQYRLRSAGLRPINNIVDVTNYVMLEFGQPLHAFDYERLKGGEIIVRRARQDEKMVTLDGETRSLSSDMLVIADREEPVAIAGVMGGLPSEVTEKTHTVLLESAWFDPLSIRMTASRLGMRTEASQRFEKGINPEGVLPALHRAAQLIEELGAGDVTQGDVDEYVRPVVPRSIRLRLSRTNRVLGTSLSGGEIQEILGRLDFPCEICGRDALLVGVPPHRVDINGEIDLIEEVARLYGYDRIPTTSPVGMLAPPGKERGFSLKDFITDAMITFGLDEVITYSFIGEGALNRLRVPADSPLRKALRIQNPLREEQSIMRTTLLPGLMDTIIYNYNRKLTDLGFFEVGNVFIPKDEGGLPEERLHLGIAACGKVVKGWQVRSEDVDFYYVKGIVEGLLELAGVADVTYEPTSKIPTLHPGRAARILAGGRELGFLGELHPDVLSNCELNLRVVVCEIDLEELTAVMNLKVMYRQIPRYPGVTRDLAVLVPLSVRADQVEKTIYSCGGELLRECRLFDVYQGEQVPEGYRSLAYSLLFQSPDRTLTDEEVAEVYSTIVKSLIRNLGARQR